MGSERTRILLVDEGTPALRRYLHWLSPLAELHLSGSRDGARWCIRAHSIDVVLWCFACDHEARATEISRWFESQPGLPPVVFVLPACMSRMPSRPFVVGLPAPPGPLWGAIRRSLVDEDRATS